MSSNINLVDKLNPISFEQNDEFKIKIDPKIIDDFCKTIENNNTKKNEDSIKDSKVTISLSKDEQDLIDLEKLHDQCLNDMENIIKKAKEKNETNNIIKLNTENVLKKKLIITSLLNPLLNLF